MENINLLVKDRGLLKRLISNYHFPVKISKRNYLKFRSTEKYVQSMVSFDNFVIGKKNNYRYRKVFKLKEEI